MKKTNLSALLTPGVNTYTHFKKCGNNQVVLKLFTTVFLAIALLLIDKNMQAQNLLWQQTYLAGNETHGYSIKQTFDGGFIVGGSVTLNDTTKDIFVIRTDANGDTVWTKQIGGTANDEAFCIEQTSDSGFVVAGYTNSYGNGSSDFFLVKLNGSGAIQWTRTNGGALADGSYSVIATKDGGYLVTGYTSSSGAGGRDVQVYKFNSGGNTQWNKTVGGALEDVGYSATQLFDSTYIIAGSSKSFSGNSNVDVYVIKLKTNGDTLWTKTYPDTGTDIAYAVYACEETGFVVAGKTNSTVSNDYNMLLMKIFDDGYLIWRKNYGTSLDDVAYDIKETKNYSFTLAGVGNDNGNGGQAFSITVSDFGEYLSELLVSDVFPSELRCVVVTNDNMPVATGSIYNATLSSPVAGVIAYPFCELAFRRGIWFSQSWQFNSHYADVNTTKTLLIDDYNAPTGKTWQQKVDDFVQYCKATKMHTVVLAHLEDIIRFDLYDANQNQILFSNFPNSANQCTCYPTAYISGNTVRNRLKSLVSDLHHIAGVSLVLAQWLDQTPGRYNIKGNICTSNDCNYATAYDDDEGNIAITNNLEILDAFCALNSPNGVPFNLGFDGLMLDYEYCSPYYGDANSNDECEYYINFKAGFEQWKLLATEFINARANKQNTGVRFVEAWLNYIVMTDPDKVYNTATCTIRPTAGIFDIADPNLSPNPDGFTDEYDSHFAIHEIDAYQFDGIAYAFINRDNINTNSVLGSGTYKTNQNPTTFLNGEKKNNGDVSDQERMRQAILYFSDDPGNYKTPITPWFRTISKIDCITDEAHLGDLMMAHCDWWDVNNQDPNGWPLPGSTDVSSKGYHFFYEIETEYLNQYKNYDWGNNNNLYSEFLNTLSNFYDYSSDKNWGSVNLFRGFQYYQYGLNDENILVTTHDALLDNSHVPLSNEREEDMLITYFGFTLDCNSPQRPALETVIEAKPQKSTLQTNSEEIEIQLLLQYQKALIKVSQPDLINMESFLIYNDIGKDVTGNFRILNLDDGHNFSIELDNHSTSHFILKVIIKDKPFKYYSLLFID